MRLLRPWILTSFGLVAGSALAAPQQAAPVAAADSVPAAATAIADSGPADPAIDLFVGKCASCHTVGKGDRVGPDLKGVTDRRDRGWIERIVLAPSRMLDSDPEARALLQKYNGVRMPDLGLTSAQVTTLVDLVARCSAEPCELVGKFTPVTAATPEQVALGRALFSGHVPLRGGAVPCLSCHTVDVLNGVPGGTLSKNLTHVFARLGDEGLDAALKNPTFKLMNKVYTDRPLESEEVFALRAFLSDANRSQATGSDVWSVLLVAVLLSVVAMAVLNGFWRRRLQGVRATVTTRKGIAL